MISSNAAILPLASFEACFIALPKFVCALAALAAVVVACCCALVAVVVVVVACCCACLVPNNAFINLVRLSTTGINDAVKDVSIGNTLSNIGIKA